jgi:putative acyl-CoA dehydrogenase
MTESVPYARLGAEAAPARNMPGPPPDQNLFTSDAVLLAACERDGIAWVHERATAVGRQAGSAHHRELARLANEHLPVLRTHDPYGERIDFVEFHPAYHDLARDVWGAGTHALAWTTTEARPHTARTVLFYLWNQLEQGVVGCSNLMSYAIVPLLRSDPEVGERWLPQVLASAYDPRPIPGDGKPALSVAMGMTEKQGGSDLRANETRAVPTGEGRAHLLTGHKYFVSAPMADLILLTARTEAGVSLFVAPRSLDDGQRNRIRIQRLKHKVGNASNASSEIELDGALAYRIGEDGHGAREFVRHMTHYIRMGLAAGSAGIMRQALTLALHHAGNRRAFGQTIRGLPQMSNALADLALESEAALLLALRSARATDDAGTSPSEALLNRVLVPVAKFWNCRRAGAVTLEAMECHGGMGYVEEQAIARLYREAPLNSIWEGTSAMMGLDLLRTFRQLPDARDLLLEELRLAAGSDRHYDAELEGLTHALDAATLGDESRARGLLVRIAQALQAGLLIRQGSEEVADTFCASRLGGEWARELGTLEASPTTLARIVDRAAPS